MQFHNWNTMFDDLYKIDKSLKKKSLHELHMQKVKHLAVTWDAPNESARTRRILRLSAEFGWHMEGKPYYKIHPEMVNKLCKTNLDKIPAKYIEIPNFTTICFRFSNNVPIIDIESDSVKKGEYGESTSYYASDDPVYVRSVLFSKFSKEQQNEINIPNKARDIGFGEEDSFIICLDEGFRQDYGNYKEILGNVFTIMAKPNETIPEAISRTINEERGIQKELMELMRPRLENLFRVIISTGFLVNTPEDNLIVPDIINKDKDKYKEAVASGDQEKIQSLVAKSARRGQNGWNVGTNEIFAGEHAPEGSASTGEGRELKYSHIRGGHPHAVRYGKGKEKVKIKWFRPSRVRKDLPFKNEEKE